MYTHAGEIGSVWKHLHLAEILSHETPNSYWESHSGSALHEIASNPTREHGVYYFLEHAQKSENLTDSVYFRILERYQNGTLSHYPGSPLIGVELLTFDGGKVKNFPNPSFLFCDVDKDCILDIRSRVEGRTPDNFQVDFVHGDGISTLLGALKSRSWIRNQDIFVFIDPYFHWETGADEQTALDLFCEFSRAGVSTMMWHGYPSEELNNKFERELEKAFEDNDVAPASHQTWRTSIELNSFDTPEFTYNEGLDPAVIKSGIICSNLRSATRERCWKLGNEFTAIYESAEFPNGHDGSLTMSASEF